MKMFLPKLIIEGAYNLVWIKEEDEWKLTFCTKYDHLEYYVISFDFTNALVIFYHLMNDVFKNS